MTLNPKPPRLFRGPLTGRIYIVTNYLVDDHGDIVASSKHDVTEDFLSLETAHHEQVKSLTAEMDDLRAKAEDYQTRYEIAHANFIASEELRSGLLSEISTRDVAIGRLWASIGGNV